MARTSEDVDADIIAQLQAHAGRAAACWVWQGSLWSNGYGRIARHLPISKFSARAHRAAWQLAYGDIGSLFVCHKCDVRRCVNPAHLWLGTNQANQIDARDKGVFSAYWTPERRAFARAKMSGAGNPMYGRSGTAAPAFGRCGAAHPMFGRRHTEDTKTKISNSLLEFHRGSK